MDQFRFLGNCPPTPSHKITSTVISHFRQNDGLREGLVGHCIKELKRLLLTVGDTRLRHLYPVNKEQ